MAIKKNLKILQISTTDNIGGAALSAWNLGKSLTKYGYDVKYFVAYKNSSEDNVYQFKNGLFRNDFASKIGNDVNRFITKFISNDIDLGAQEEILNHSWYKNADIIHCHNLHGSFFKLETLVNISKYKKIDWTLHDEWAIMAHGAWSSTDEVKNGFFKRNELSSYPPMFWDNERYLSQKKRKIYKNIKLNIVVPCRWLKKRVERSILKKQKNNLIYYGINNKVFKKYDKEVVRNTLKLPLNKKIITLLANGGKRNKQKGWDYTNELVNFYKNDDQILFLCIGGKAKNEKNINNIRYINYIDNNNLLARYYSASDVFILTSIADNLPQVVLEAMSCGVPVVSFDVGGVKEAVIHKKNGYIAKYRDIKDLIRGVNYISNLNKEELEAMSLNSIKRVKKYFTLTKMTKNYIDLYQSLI